MPSTPLVMSDKKRDLNFAGYLRLPEREDGKPLAPTLHGTTSDQPRYLERVH
jgi:hypothetical protein